MWMLALGLCVLCAGLAMAGEPWMNVAATRLAQNPILKPGMAGIPGRNINGPCLVRVPEWLPRPLGRYYLYFADHGGKYIRLAFADSLHGPWTVHAPGTLRLEQTVAEGHIASPDILFDPEQRRLRMYFHGPTAEGQMTFLATSKDGLEFTAQVAPLAPFYLRVVRYGGWHYGVAKLGNRSGILLRSKDGIEPFERGPQIIPRMRHAALVLKDDRLLIFFSRIGDKPERILLTRFDLRGEWTGWESSATPYLTVLKPEKDYEGIGFPLGASSAGAKTDVHQLRDPHVYEEDGRMYLVYSVAGETGLAIAELRLDPAPAGR